MLVLVKPGYPDFLEIGLFEPGDKSGALWHYPFRDVKQILAAQGITMETWNMHPLREPDVVLFQDLPKTAPAHPRRRDCRRRRRTP